MTSAADMPPQAETAQALAYIMVVEDDVLIRSVLSDQLRDNGLRVIECATADEAWNYLIAGGHADLIFSDIVMPGSMDGNELAKRVNLRFPSTHIILTSGNLAPRTDVKIERFLPKPYNSDHVILIMMKALGIT